MYMRISTVFVCIHPGMSRQIHLFQDPHLLLKLCFWLCAGFFFFQCWDGIQGLAHVKDTLCYLVILPALNPPQALRPCLVSSSPLDCNKTVSCGPLDYKVIVV